MTIGETQERIIKDFEGLTDWEDRYREIIELGRKLAPINEAYKTDKYKLSGCQSQVWLNSKYENGKVLFEAENDNGIRYGFTDNSDRVTLDLKDGKKVSVDFSDRASHDLPYAAVTLDGQPWIFEFPTLLYDYVVRFLAVPPSH